MVLLIDCIHISPLTYLVMWLLAQSAVARHGVYYCNSASVVHPSHFCTLYHNGWMYCQNFTPPSSSVSL